MPDVEYHFKPNAKARPIQGIAIELNCNWTNSRHITINFLSIKLFALDHLKSYFAVNQKEFANRCDQNRQQIVEESDRNDGTQILQKRRKSGEKKRSRPQPLDVLGCHRRKPLCQHRQHYKVSNLTVLCAHGCILAKPHNINVSTIPFPDFSPLCFFPPLWSQTARALHCQLCSCTIETFYIHGAIAAQT